MTAVDLALSPASIARQVRREGKRWGLTAVIVRGRDNVSRVKVCRSDRRCESRSGLAEVRRTQTPIATVDEDHPFSEVLVNRTTNGEVDMARRAREADKIEEAAMQKRADEYDDETRAIWKTRNRITLLPNGTVIPAGLANRRG